MAACMQVTSMRGLRASPVSTELHVGSKPGSGCPAGAWHAVWTVHQASHLQSPALLQQTPDLVLIPRVYVLNSTCKMTSNTEAKRGSGRSARWFGRLRIEGLSLSLGKLGLHALLWIEDPAIKYVHFGLESQHYQRVAHWGSAAAERPRWAFNPNAV